MKFLKLGTFKFLKIKPQVKTKLSRNDSLNLLLSARWILRTSKWMKWKEKWEYRQKIEIHIASTHWTNVEAMTLFKKGNHNQTRSWIEHRYWEVFLNNQHIKAYVWKKKFIRIKGSFFRLNMKIEIDRYARRNISWLY